MNTSKQWPKLRLILLLSALLLFGTGCVASRIGVSWPSIGLTDVSGQTEIVVAYNQQISLIDPVTGMRAQLRNAEGEVRLDEQGNPRPWFFNGADHNNLQFFAQPLLQGETFLFPSYNDSMVEIDQQTSRLENTYPLPDFVIAEVVEDDDMLYVPLFHDGIAAVDAGSFEVLWQFDMEQGVWATPLLVDGVLYVPSVDHNLYALNAETGTPVWDEPVDLEGLAAATPLLYEDHLFIGSYSHKLFKISLDGEIVGELMAENWIWSPPVEFEGVLYLTDLSGFVRAIDPETMNEFWSVRVAERGIRPAPLVTSGSVVVASRDGRVYWLDRRTGELIFSREIEGRPEILSDIVLIEANPESGLSEDLVIVSTVDPARQVAAFTLENGRAAWVYSR